MRVLTPRVGETVRIVDQQHSVEVRVLGTNGDLVALGFNAPEGVAIVPESTQDEAISDEGL